MADTVRSLLMDKVVFFFRRKDGLSREEFHDHYLHDHAPLGLRVTATMDGYTVNLVDSDSGAVDAVTEVWTAALADFFDPSKSFATEDDAKTLMADHDSFIGPYDAYAVEEQVVHGALPDAPLGEVAPGAKVFVRYASADGRPRAARRRDVRRRPAGGAEPHAGLARARGGAHDLAGGSRRGHRPLGRGARRRREVRMKPPF